MSEFLSTQWLDELDRAARASDALTALGRKGPFVVEQVVVGAPQGDVTYHVIVDEHGGRVTSGPAPRTPHVTLRTDYTTAVEIHRGANNAQGALTRGRYQISGDVGSLVRRGEMLGALEDVFASVRSTTTTPALGSGDRR